MDSITIPVPTLTTLSCILIGIGILVVVFVCLRRGARSNFEQNKQKEEERAVAREKLRVLFPHPWDEAYGGLVDIHRGCEIWIGSRIYLRRWLAEHTNLPHLSREAVHKLACMLTCEYSKKWEECLEMFVPYSDVKSLKTLEDKIGVSK